MVGFGALARKLFGSANERRLKGYRPKVDAINALESEIRALTNEQLRAKTDEFKTMLAAGAKVDDLLVPAFAVVREASRRALGQRHFDVQLIGGMVLNDSAIAEMRTGEGKTLVATLPSYLNALTGRGVHVVTVNDYLAKRDSDWMGRVHRFLGLTVGCIVHDMTDDQRREAYACDITYGTNNELGFDYLRDNMKYEFSQMVQRGHYFAVVDEVDSILVDEARTPLIISGPLEDRSDLYNTIDRFIPVLGPEDYEMDEKARTVTFTEIGTEKLQGLLAAADLLKSDDLYDVENVSIVHHVNQALRAHKMFARDKDYIVRNNEVVIIDEFTGRMMPGRRYSEGLHQALEAKEHVAIQPENMTMASITFQNYFRMYEKLGGMTGTASTEAEEFADIYNLEVVEIPTNLKVSRIDDDDEVYRTQAEKHKAIVEVIKEAKGRGQPVLVGTTSIEKSEELARLLQSEGFVQRDFSVLFEGDHGRADEMVFQVLNARYHEQEAHIIAQAGLPGAVTIATNMAGRGTDIQLGGNAELRIEAELGDMPDGEERQAREVKIREDIARLKEIALKAGGLFVIATERHESRRIDNQLRGRSGRQGDPGRSRFYLSLQDDLMRIFGSDRMDSMLVKLGLKEGEAIVHPWINKALEKAQQKVEARNFDIRKNLLKFDDVMNDQRKVIFEQRIELMRGEDLDQTVQEMLEDVVEAITVQHIPANAYAEQWDIEGLARDVVQKLNINVPVADWAHEEGIADEEMKSRLLAATRQAYAEREARFTPEVMRYIEKQVILQTLDHLWREHLAALDALRSVIGFRGYAQRDPLNEYKTEAFQLFEALLDGLRSQVVAQLMRLELREPESEPALPPMTGIHVDPQTGENEMERPTLLRAIQGGSEAGARNPNDPATWGEVGRNEACPCGSGKKYKHCHGSFA